MTKEFAKGQQPVTSVEEFLQRKDAQRQRPAGGVLRDRGPYGYGGGLPSAKVVPNQITDETKNVNLPEPQTRAEFLNAIYDRQLRLAQKSKATDAKILRFPTNPDSVEPTK